MIIVSEICYEQTGIPVQWTNLNPMELSYLERMNIAKFEFILVPTPANKWLRSKDNSNHLCELMDIDSPAKLKPAVDRAKSILSTWRSDVPSFADVAVIITEMISNSIEHSVFDFEVSPGKCFFTIQTYWPRESSRPQIVIVFGDAGIGIRQSLATTHEWVVSNDLYAIRKVLLEPVTARESGDGGLGIQKTTEILGRYGCEITIRSGHGAIIYTPHNGNMRNKRYRIPLEGTQIGIIL